VNRTEIYNKLNIAFEDFFFDDFIFGEELTANDIEEWDSLAHVSLVVSVEKVFNIRFDAGEVTAAKNVGDLINLIERHVK
jgi:acyl carrier protein